MTKSIAIIGAGPAGLTAGLNLSKKGYKVDRRASSSVGGMSKTIKLWEQLVDLGLTVFLVKILGLIKYSLKFWKKITQL